MQSEPSRFEAYVTGEDCTGCAICAEEHYPMKAIEMKDDVACQWEMGAKVLQEKGRLDAFQQNGHTMNCPIGNLSLELAGTNERLRAFRSYLTGYFENIKAQEKKRRGMTMILNGVN